MITEIIGWMSLILLILLFGYLGIRLFTKAFFKSYYEDYIFRKIEREIEREKENNKIKREEEK